MVIEVITNLYDSDGKPVFGFEKREVIQIPQSAVEAAESGVDQFALDTAGRLLDTIDEGKASISRQVRDCGFRPS